MDLDLPGPNLETSEKTGRKRKGKETLRVSKVKQDIPALGSGGRVGAAAGSCLSQCSLRISIALSDTGLGAEGTYHLQDPVLAFFEFVRSCFNFPYYDFHRVWSSDLFILHMSSGGSRGRKREGSR